MAIAKLYADKRTGDRLARWTLSLRSEISALLRRERQQLPSSMQIVVVVFLTALLAGCARFVPSHRITESDNYNLLLLADLPATQPQILAAESMTNRGNFSPNMTGNEDAATAGTVSKPLAPARRYWRLSASQCACQAAGSAAVADLVDMERQLVAASGRPSRKGPDRAQILQQTLLKLRATDHRNQVAGTALELYYRLVEVEAGRDATRKSIQLIEIALADLSQLQGQGLSSDANEFDLQQQRLELIERQQELVLQSDELNRQLKLLLNATGIEPPIWPDLKLKVVFEPIDADLAVAIGVETRADLTILRLLAGTSDSTALATARSALRQREGSLGNQSPGLRDLIQGLQTQRVERELSVRRRQLSRLLAVQHQTAVSEIRGAANEIGVRERQILLSRAKLDKHRQRQLELEQQQQAGGATAFDVFEERLKIIRVESELTQHVVAWKIAQVKLKQAQGILAEQCGYGRSLHAPDMIPHQWRGLKVECAGPMRLSSVGAIPVAASLRDSEIRGFLECLAVQPRGYSLNISFSIYDGQCRAASRQQVTIT